MSRHWSTPLLAGAFAAGMMFAAPAAEASFVQVRDGNGGGNVFNGGPGYVNLTINVNNVNQSVSAGAFALQYRLGPSDPWTDFLTYCLEADEALGISSDGTPVSGTFAPDISATSEYAASADSLMRLYATWFEDSLTSPTKSAAFQIATWELATDSGSLTGINLAAGNFKFTTTGAVLTQAAAYLDMAGWDPAGDLGVILRVGNQDLLLAVDTPTTGTNIPEPATLALFGLGLLGLSAARRRRQV